MSALEAFGDWLEVNVAAHGLVDSIDAIDIEVLAVEELQQLHIDLCDLVVALGRRAHHIDRERAAAEVEYVQRSSTSREP